MKKKLLAMMKNALKCLRYTMKGSSFYRTFNNVIFVINLQKSQWGEAYYLNVGLFFKEIDSIIEKPLEYKCHLRFRIEDYITVEHSINTILDPRNEIIESEKFDKEFSYIAPLLDAYLQELTDKDKLRNLIKTQHRLSYHMVGDLKKLLESRD